MRKREIAAYVLSQLGTTRRPYKKESTRILLRALSREQNTAVRAMIILALGFLKSRPAMRRVLGFANDRSPRVRGEVALYIGDIYCMRSKSIPPRLMRLLHKFNAERSRVVRWHASLALELVRGPTPEERAERRAWLAKQRKKAHK
ncbi:MAG TPA: HEAT repeat domain-containing protein [Candidatus Binatia bacterium]